MAKIVWLASYPKSGNTWFRMFLANYLKDSIEPLPLEDIERTTISSSPEEFEDESAINPFELTSEEVDNYRPANYRSVAANSSERLIFKKTHDAYTINSKGEPIFPGDASYGAVYFVRNPLDVAISYANHNTSGLDKVICTMIKDNAFIGGRVGDQLRQILLTWDNHYYSWQNQNQIPVHTVRYEDMVMKSKEIFGSIVNWLELPYDEERIDRALKNSNFKTLQEMEQRDGFRERLQNCKQFFWKGKIGNYREHLTLEQIELLTGRFERLMSQLGYIDANGELTV